MDGHDHAAHERWLTLSAAAEVVGVHPSTLREWADHGMVGFLRTPGGHRRFLERELRAFIAQRSEGRALVVISESTRAIADRTLQQIHRSVPASAPWHSAYDPVAIEGQREQGRRLLGLAMRYVAGQAGRDGVLAEAEEIGRKYGHDAAIRQISLPDTVRAFYFFRDSLVRSARPVAADAVNDEEDNERISRDLRAFLDVVFFAMLASFEVQQRQSS